jgi:hypothetical protein
MENIEIKKEERTKSGWNFLIEVGGNEDKIEYSVTLDEEYWEKLTNGQHPPAELIRRSFEFLLEREPKESILRKFNLNVINRYFREYENKIKK